MKTIGASFSGGGFRASAFTFGCLDLLHRTRFGDRNQYELGLRLQHMSNANIKSPNNGLTWGALRFAWKF